MQTSSTTIQDGLLDEELDRIFMALANRTRREMLRHLSENGSATMSELAEPFAISQPGASKHVRVLERAGLVNREVDGRLHHCRLDSGPLDTANSWLRETRTFWEAQLDALAEHFTEDPESD